ncbi:MAG: hypothetical protein ACI8Z9_002285 [Paraglaciecola sp.]|jgi:hypothetical protein
MAVFDSLSLVIARPNSYRPSLSGLLPSQPKGTAMPALQGCDATYKLRDIEPFNIDYYFIHQFFLKLMFSLLIDIFQKISVYNFYKLKNLKYQKKSSH